VSISMWWYILFGGVIAVFVIQKFLKGSPNYKRKFEKKSVVIVGASSGIGEELALQVSRHKPKLVLVARRQDKLETIKKKCLTAGAESVTVVEADVSDREKCKELIAKSVDINGGIDVLFLNAGIGQTAGLFSLETPEVLEKVFQVDYFGAMYPAFYALPHLRKSRGHITVTSSVYGKVPGKGVSAYCSAKHALHGFFDSLRIEEGRNQIHVTMVCPGYVKTSIHDRSLGSDGKEVGTHKKTALFTWTEVSLQKAAALILKATAQNEKEISFPLLCEVAVRLRGLLGANIFDRLAFGAK